jgi:hypothetical protein
MVYLGLIKSRHPGVALDDRFELGAAHDLIEIRKTIGSPLFHHVNDTLRPASTVVPDDLSSRDLNRLPAVVSISSEADSPRLVLPAGG